VARAAGDIRQFWCEIGVALNAAGQAHALYGELQSALTRRQCASGKMRAVASAVKSARRPCLPLGGIYATCEEEVGIFRYKSPLFACSKRLSRVLLESS
jgi:hypothetical protein